MRNILCWLLLASAVLAAPVLAAEPRIHLDLPYAQPIVKGQTLDVYSPAEGKNHPVVFWIHGGGWHSGDKSEAEAKPQATVDKGFVFVSTNYRLIPQGGTIKEMAGDVAKAIVWVHQHAREYGGDPNRIIVTGHSAGAQLAALVCTDNSYLKAEGLPLSLVKGCVPVDGDTYDVPLQIATVEQRRKDSYLGKFGDEKSQRDLSPLTHVEKGRYIPPFLFLHVADHPETKAQAELLAKALKEAGVSAKVFPADGTDHVKLNDDLGKPNDKPSQAMWEFFEGVLKK